VMGADHIFQAKKHFFFPFKSRVGVKIIEGTLVSISPIMWLGGTNVLSTKREEKVTRYCDGKSTICDKLLKNMQCDLSRTTYNTSGGNSDKCFKITNLNDNLESVPKLTTS
jgi:hypothetical protein